MTVDKLNIHFTNIVAYYIGGFYLGDNAKYGTKTILTALQDIRLINYIVLKGACQGKMTQIKVMLFILFLRNYFYIL